MDKLLITLLSLSHWGIIGYAIYDFREKFLQIEIEEKNAEAQVKEVTDNLDRQIKKLEQLKVYAADIEEMKKKIERAALQLEKIQKTFPKTLNDTEILGNFKNEGELLNIQRLIVEPKSETERGFYYSKGYSFSGKATFLQLLVFFERTGKNEKIFNVKELKIKVPQGGQKGRFVLLELNGILETFRHNPNFREDRGIEEIEKKFSGTGESAPSNQGAAPAVAPGVSE